MQCHKKQTLPSIQIQLSAHHPHSLLHTISSHRGSFVWGEAVWKSEEKGEEQICSSSLLSPAEQAPVWQEIILGLNDTKAHFTLGIAGVIISTFLTLSHMLLYIPMQSNTCPSQKAFNVFVLTQTRQPRQKYKTETATTTKKEWMTEK